MRASDKTAFRRRKPKSGEVDYIGSYGNYPINLDAGERFMRLRTGIDYFPYPPRIGAMQAFLRQMDVIVWRDMYRRPPTGPLLVAQVGPGGAAIPVVNTQYQIAVPGLTKSA